MSNIAIQGAATGTGVFTLASPATNTDRTLTLPDEAGTVLTTATPGVPVNGPAFSAYLGSTQAMSSGTFTKILFDTELFDTNNNFTSSRFTPTIAGYYQINAGLRVPSPVANIVVIYKNGSVYARGTYVNDGTYNAVVSALVYCNGSSDYIEVYGYTTTTSFSGIPSETRFDGCLIRSAA